MPEKRDIKRAIEKAQRDGLAKLQAQREAQLADDNAYLRAERRVVALCLETLRLYEQVQRAFEDAVSEGQETRSSYSQQELEDQAAFLLREAQLGISRIVQDSIQHVRSDLPHTRPREKVVREVIVQPPPTLGQVWKTFIRELPEPVLLIGTLLKGLFQYAALALCLGLLFRNPYIAIFVPLGTYFFLHEGGFLAWGIIPSGIALLVWVVLVVF